MKLRITLRTMYKTTRSWDSHTVSYAITERYIRDCFDRSSPYHTAA
ncbi:MAG: hypothetical protein FWG70_11625 [Oscillospiraceae bacterium]|nr:hypothetical protein [Oscillospiraceae bacterium]